ncbi:SDR family NAD(P)-dependent oxidoreductase [Actinomadura rugatobispora]|uniref:SDR family NAD(P)-dependent oxidoreductase n=1 Tax=Actinomadura rugatobispora TaxID=1994 RepID=A0ABW1A2C6_9ACTN
MTDDTKIALVTGANKGIGFEIAAGLAGLGMTVLVGARDEGRRADAVARLKNARGIALDVTDQSTVDAAAAEIGDRYGRLDVLVNNAGVPGTLTPPSACEVAEIKEVFEANLFGVVRVTNAMLPLLRRSPSARIVNVSSGTGSLTNMTDPGHYFTAMPAAAAYVSSKSALNMLTVQYAKELRADGVLVNCAIPGPCNTDFLKGLDLGIPITRTAADGAAIAVKLATLGPDGPTGGAFDDNGAYPW